MKGGHKRNPIPLSLSTITHFFCATRFSSAVAAPVGNKSHGGGVAIHSEPEIGGRRWVLEIPPPLLARSIGKGSIKRHQVCLLPKFENPLV